MNRRLLEHAQDVVLAQDQMLLALDFDFAARVLAEQDLVAGLHIGREQLALLGHLALAHRDHLAFLRLLFRGVGDDNPALGLLLFLDTLDQNAIALWTERNRFSASTK